MLFPENKTKRINGTLVVQERYTSLYLDTGRGKIGRHLYDGKQENLFGSYCRLSQSERW